MKYYEKYIRVPVQNAKECLYRNRESGLAFFNQILEDIPFFKFEARRIVKRERAKALAVC